MRNCARRIYSALYVRLGRFRCSTRQRRHMGCLWGGRPCTRA